MTKDMTEFEITNKYIDNVNRLIKPKLRAIANAYKSIEATVDKIREFENELCDLNTKVDELTEELELLGCELIDEVFPEEDAEEPCYVYYISNRYRDRIKIGISKDPIQRAKYMQTSIGDELIIENVIKFKNRREAQEVEKALHSHFYAYRFFPSKVSKSTEWFDICILKDLKRYFWTHDDVKGLAEYDSKVAFDELSSVSFF